MKKLCGLLLLVFGMASCSSTSSDTTQPTADPNEPPDSTFDWSSLPAATPVVYSRGTPVIVAEVTVDQGGGTVAGTAGTPIDGVVVTIPAGAVEESTTFQLGYDNGTFANLPAGDTPGAVIVLESSGTHVFKQPLKIEYPHSDATLPTSYYIDESGALDVLPSSTRTSGLGNFITWHASDFTFIDHDPNRTPVFNGFYPSVDGFPFPNPDVRYVTGGRCWGMADYAKWYRAAHGSGLSKQFQDPVGTVQKSQSSTDLIGPKTSQSILTTRAHLSVSQHGKEIFMQDPEDFIFIVKAAISMGPYGVMLGLVGNFGGRDNTHSILAIGYTDNQIAVYDPNYPGKIKAIDYNLTGPEPKVRYGKYQEFGTWGNGEQSRVEAYSHIHEDATANFHNENETKIEITSHNTGDTVGSSDISLEGKVYSGQVRVNELELHVLDPGETEEQPPRVLPMPPTADKSFAFPITLKKGESRIWFVTRGYNINGVSPLPNDSFGLPDKELFALNYDKDFVPKGSLVVSTETSVESADTHTTTSLTYSANLSFVTYDMGKQVNLANFDFASCTYASQNCTIVTAMSVDSVPFIDANNVPITAEFHRKTYQKGSSGEELVGFTDASGSLTCQRVIVHIAVEPGSTKDNYRYRVHIAPGGYCMPSSVQTTGKYKSGEDWYDNSPEDFTIGEDMVLSLDGVNDTGCVTASTIQPEAIEEWAADPTSTKSWSVGGDANCDDGSFITTEHALATITLIP